MMNGLIYSMILLILGGFGLIMNFNHVMSMLICLEFMLMGLIWFVVCMVGVGLYEGWMIFVVLFVMVCESALGIGMMVALSSSHGLEMIDSMIISMW